MTSIEAYESLGFDTKKLGKNCAQSAQPSAQDRKRRTGEFEPKAENYDGSIPIEEMPEMSLEEKVAYQEARIRYLEDYVEFQKKCLPYWRRYTHPSRDKSKGGQALHGL